MRDRIPDRHYSEVIGEGLARLPTGMRHRLGLVRFVCGVDPVFAGIHAWSTTTDGRDYRDIAHHVQPFNVLGPRDPRTDVVVIPTLRNVHPHIVVHELGHALDLTLGCTHWYGDRANAEQDGATRALFRYLGRG